MRNLVSLALVSITVLIVVYGGFHVYRTMRDVRESARRTQIMGNLKQLAVAMHSYHEVHKAFPPHAIYGNDGQPLLSWRVLLLPYMEHEDLFKKFKLDEPWDSPHNIKLLPQMPRFYGPADGQWTPQTSNTHIQVFVGPGAAFEGAQGMKFREDFPDGTSLTFLIVHAGKPVPWTKPEDLQYSPNQPLPNLDGLFPGSFQAVMVDAMLRHVRSTTSETTLRAAITRNTRDKIGADWGQ